MSNFASSRHPSAYRVTKQLRKIPRSWARWYLTRKERARLYLETTKRASTAPPLSTLSSPSGPMSRLSRLARLSRLSSPFRPSTTMNDDDSTTMNGGTAGTSNTDGVELSVRNASASTTTLQCGEDVSVNREDVRTRGPFRQSKLGRDIQKSKKTPYPCVGTVGYFRILVVQMALSALLSLVVAIIASSCLARYVIPTAVDNQAMGTRYGSLRLLLKLNEQREKNRNAAPPNPRNPRNPQRWPISPLRT